MRLFAEDFVVVLLENRFPAGGFAQVEVLLDLGGIFLREIIDVIVRCMKRMDPLVLCEQPTRFKSMAFLCGLTVRVVPKYAKPFSFAISAVFARRR